MFIESNTREIIVNLALMTRLSSERSDSRGPPCMYLVDGFQSTIGRAREKERETALSRLAADEKVEPREMTF